jgi:hypothetical protein
VRAVKITRANCVAAYEFLTSLHPIKTWKLPPSRDVEFRVKPWDKFFGEYDEAGIITISSRKHGHLDTLLRTMAHEMIHQKLHLDGHSNWELHDQKFLSLAEAVGIELGFDPKEL